MSDQPVNQNAALRLYVAPDGNDTWSGQLAQASNNGDGPLASLSGAHDALRRLKLQEAFSGPVVVSIADGEYAVTEPLILSPEDGGTAIAPISYEAADGARPVFNGGSVINGWKAGADGVWTAQIPEVANGQWYFEQLWINGRRATRARLPKQFYFYAASAAEAGNDPTHGDPETLARRAFRAHPDDIAPLLQYSPAQLRDVTLVAYHSLETTRRRIAAIDKATGTVYLIGNGEWPFFAWGKPERYHIENLREALDTAGEWFLDRDGTIFYKPLPDEDMTSATVIAPRAEAFIRFEGKKELPIEHVSFKGLAFRYSQYVLPYEGHGDEQAECRLPGVIMVDDAQHINIENCEIAHTGLHAVWFRRGCRHNSLQHCHLHDLGAGGVYIGETVITSHEDDRTSHITVDNNIIQAGGRIHAGAHGIWIGHSGDNRLTHNDIGDFFYTGIAAGWHWGYGESLAKRNKIEFNHIHHLGQGVLRDMGAIYTLGPSEGTTISNNHLHDIWPYHDKGWGMYTDEGSSYIVLENNLVHDTKNGAFHQHYGRENIIRNNIFAFGLDHQMERSAIENHLSYTFENNIVYWNGGPLQCGDWNEQVVIRHNLYWNTGDADEEVSIEATGTSTDPTQPYLHVELPRTSLRQWQEMAREEGMVVADPGFVDAESRDFRLAEDSPALQTGFKPFDASRAGVYGDAEWVELACSTPMPAAQVAPPAPEA